MISLVRRVLPWARFAAPYVVKKVRDVKASSGVGFVQKWEVASWQKVSDGSGWSWRTEYAGASRVRSAMAARRARADTGTVRVTYRGR